MHEREEAGKAANDASSCTHARERGGCGGLWWLRTSVRNMGQCVGTYNVLRQLSTFEKYERPDIREQSSRCVIV